MSYTVTYDIKGVDEILRYDTLRDEGPCVVIEVAIEQTEQTASLISCNYGGKLGVGVIFERRKRIPCSHFSLVRWATTICDVHWLVDINEWWEGTEPPTNVASWCLCLRGNPDFPLGTSPLFVLGHYPLSPEFLSAHNKPKDLSKNQPKTLLGLESLSRQTDWFNHMWERWI